MNESDVSYILKKTTKRPLSIVPTQDLVEATATLGARIDALQYLKFKNEESYIKLKTRLEESFNRLLTCLGNSDSIDDSQWETE